MGDRHHGHQSAAAAAGRQPINFARDIYDDGNLQAYRTLPKMRDMAYRRTRRNAQHAEHTHLLFRESYFITQYKRIPRVIAER